MSMMRGLVAGSIAGAVLMAGAANAATTGTVGAVSEYMFRGISSSNGAAIQGSLDWSDDSGFYAGVWGSNTAPLLADGTEVDLYGGYKFKLSDISNIDLGVIYYAFPENEEVNVACNPLVTGVVGCNISYPEVYAGLTYAGFAGKVYYTNDFFSDANDYVGSPGEDAYYVNLSYGFDIKEGLNLKGAVGYQAGDGAEAVFGEEVTDYAVTLTKALESGFAASFAIVGSDLDTGVFDDDPKFVIGLSKGFEI
jgi:uncharacterized protein (TIGR02001 family)